VAGDLDLERQFLHAHRLVFTHPLTQAEIDISSELPEDLGAALTLARRRPEPLLSGTMDASRSINPAISARAVVPRSAIGARFRPGPPEQCIRNHSERGWSRWQSSP